ncbi:hypothetical protein Scep_004075 [Stephania cephalantha]|uniref:Uncharacterized protein n=1 Tax=Stephania cephalantha TaxID=152367 RepID=A0AAP0KRV5_9MAGN
MTTSPHFVTPSPSSSAHTTSTSVSSPLNVEMHEVAGARTRRQQDRVKIFVTVEHEEYHFTYRKSNEAKIYEAYLKKAGKRTTLLDYATKPFRSENRSAKSSRRLSYRAEDGQALWEEYEELREQLMRQMQGEMQEERERQQKAMEEMEARHQQD